MRAIIALLVACAMSLAGPAAAQSGFPERPIRMVVPFAAGGAADIVSRLVAQGMAEDLGQPVVVENRGGSGGVIGSQAALGAPADGYTIVFHTASSAVLNVALYRNLPFDMRRSFVPVSLVGLVPNIIVVNPRLPVANLRDFVEHVRRNPGRVTYASSGPGTIVHLSGHMLAGLIGVEMVHVPYRGSGPALNDLIAGTVDMMVDTLPPYVAMVREGRVRALAMATRTRSPAMPEVPTAEEAGLPGYETYNWHAIFATVGTPAPVVARLERAARAAVAAPTIRQRLVDVGVDPRGGSAEELAAFWDAQLALWIPVARSSGATAD